jgi:hypothetical protein
MAQAVELSVSERQLLHQKQQSRPLGCCLYLVYLEAFLIVNSFTISTRFGSLGFDECKAIIKENMDGMGHG